MRPPVMVRHRRAALLAGLLLAGLLAWPRPALAQCGGYLPDLGACADAAQYAIWRGFALTVWQGNQTLLLGAHQVEEVRWYLVDSVFLSLYHALAGGLTPLIGPLGRLALSLAALSLALIPILGRVAVGNLRQIVILLAVLPILFAEAGPQVVALEHARSDLAGELFGGFRAEVPSTLFGRPRQAEMLPIAPLDYTACGDVSHVPAGGVDLAATAAALIWADWRDIACPQQAGSPLPDFPARWSEAAPAGAGYLYAGDVGDLSDAHERAGYIAGAQFALARAIWALVPSLLALLEATIQLVFSLCTIILALSGLLTLLLALFQQTFAGISTLVGGAAQVLGMSVAVSAALNLLTAILLGAATSGHAQGFVAVAVVALGLVVFLGFVALGTLRECFLTATRSLGAGAGVLAPALAQTGRAVQRGATTAADAGVVGATRAAQRGMRVAQLATYGGLVGVGMLASAMRSRGGATTGQVRPTPAATPPTPSGTAATPPSRSAASTPARMPTTSTGAAPVRRRSGPSPRQPAGAGAAAPAASTTAGASSTTAPAGGAGAPRQRFMPRRALAQQSQAAQAEIDRQQRQARARAEAQARAARRRPPPAPAPAGQPLDADDLKIFGQDQTGGGPP